MNEAKQVKARAKALRAEKAALQAKLAEARDRETGAIRLKLAAVEEDLVDCARLLRELMPRHKISRGKTWSGLEGWQWDKLQYQTWAELEGAESPEGPTEQDKMRLAVRAARTGLTPAQEAYLAQTDVGKRPAQVAREAGKHRSTVCRTLRRGKDRIAEDAKVLYDLLGRREGGPLVIDLGEPEVLKAVLDRLTTRQQTYLYLYYGEWLSLREIGTLLGVDHASVRIMPRCSGPSGAVCGGWRAWLWGSRWRCGGWTAWRSGSWLTSTICLWRRSHGRNGPIRNGVKPPPSLHLST